LASNAYLSCASRSGWDAISFQPLLKSGAVSLKKVADDTTETSLEQQTSAAQRAREKGAAQHSVLDMKNRGRYLEAYLALWEKSAEELIGLFDDLEPSVEDKFDYRTGIKLMKDLAVDAIQALHPYCRKYAVRQLSLLHYLLFVRIDIARNLYRARER
jgi:hypothetical protein